MQKKATAIIAILVASMILAVLPVSVVHAITIDPVSPTSGKVGIEVAFTGTIDTPGGSWTVEFYNGAAYVSVKAGTCASGETSVSTTFTVPNATAGAHDIKLTDLTTGGFVEKFGAFSVVTWWYVTADPDRVQEGQTTSVIAKVTGGASGTWYNYTVEVTNPKAVVHSTWFNFTADTVGYGSDSHTYPTEFTAGANTNYTGTYDMNFTSPTPQTGSFTVGLTDKLAYDRTETVSIIGSGYGASEVVTVDITFAGVNVTGYPKNITASAGVITDSWLIPWNVSLGTYTVTLTNATTPGTVKTPADVQSFDVKVATLTPTVPTLSPAPPYSRTDTVKIEYTITYPDGSLYNDTTFSSVTVSVYANTSLVDTISIPKTNYNPTTGVWNATWKIPRDASVGIGYSFNFTVNSIVDFISQTPNSGPSAYVASSTFEVEIADLTVMVTDQPADNYTRTETATAKINITYPDTTFFTSADLGSILVRVMRAGVNIANVTLAAGDFDSATNKWTVGWVIPWNATKGTEPLYWFRVEVNEAIDASGNKGPTPLEDTDTFQVFMCLLDITSVNTDKASYERGDYVIISFYAYYLDGSPVVVGDSEVILTAPDGYTTVPLAPVPVGGGRFQVRWWLSDAEQVGTWKVTLTANLTRDYDDPDNLYPNIGPKTSLVTYFTVEVPLVVLDVEADVGSIHFRAEKAEFYVLVSHLGASIDVDTVTPNLYRPDGTMTLLTATRVDTGLYKIEYTVPADAPAGTHTLVVRVSLITAEFTGQGTTLKAFLLSPTLSGWDPLLVSINGSIALIQTDIGTIQTDIATINGRLTAIEGSIATIETDIGTIQTDVAAINAAITALEGSVATIETDVGTIKVTLDAINTNVVAIEGDIATIETSLGTIEGSITSIEGDVATIETDLGTVSTDVSDVMETSEATQTGVGALMTPVIIAVILSLIAAIAAIASVVLIRRKIAG